MKKAVLFDLDGTLLNTLESISYCGNIALAHFGLQAVDTKKFPEFIGRGANALIRDLFAYVNGSADIFDSFRSYYLDIYNKNGLYKTEPYDGICRLLTILKERKIKTAVLSNKPDFIVRNACDSFFDGMFDIIFGQRDGVPAKPDPFMPNKIMKDLGVTADECIYCGDSAVDVQTGLNANMCMLGAAWGFYGDSQFENATAVLYHPLEMEKYL